MKNIQTDHPWQVTPSNLIAYGIEHSKKQDEFSRQIALLLLDVGIETLFKVYLLLGEDITHAKTKFNIRKKAASGNFYQLVEGVKESISTDIEEGDFSKIMYFHSVRNKVYHQGDGVIPAKVNVKEYADLSEMLLRELLGVNLSPEVPLDFHWKKISHSINIGIREQKIKIGCLSLQFDLSAVMSFLHPDLVLRSTIEEILSIKDKYIDRECDDIQIRSELEQRRFKELEDLTGYKLTDSYLVEQILMDIHVLYLVILLDHSGKDRIENLIMYEKIVKFTGEKSEIISDMSNQEYLDWVENQLPEYTTKMGLMDDWIQEMQITIEDLIRKRLLDG